MAQYLIHISGNPIVWTNGINTFREDVRGGIYYIDKALTALGFGIGSIEGIDWAIVKFVTGSPHGLYRDGCRDGSWVIDATLTPLGFAGIENTDWVILEQHNI